MDHRQGQRHATRSTCRSGGYTNPQPGQLGLSATQLPHDAPIWTTLNAQLATVTWQTDPATLVANTAIDTDDAQFLVADRHGERDVQRRRRRACSASFNANGAVVDQPGGAGGRAGGAGRVGAGEPTPRRKAAYVAAQKAAPQDPALISNLTTVVGAWGVAQSRKNTVNNAWGNATNPGSVPGGLAAVHAAGRLLRRPAGRRRLDADRDRRLGGLRHRAEDHVAIANDYGRMPAGTVSLVVEQGGATVATASAAVVDDAASFTLPALARARTTTRVLRGRRPAPRLHRDRLARRSRRPT